jgi:26S proteasome regulatory subunit N5
MPIMPSHNRYSRRRWSGLINRYFPQDEEFCIHPFIVVTRTGKMTAEETQPQPLMSELAHLDPLVKDPKATEDFSEAANLLIPKAQTLARAGRMLEAIEELLALEKKARFACDGLTCTRILCAVATMYYEAKDLTGLFEIIPTLVKKRGQLKRPITELVNLCTKWLHSDTLSRGDKYRFINVLAEVTEGKIFVETERARIKLYESQLKEEEGKVDEACLILQEEQVEIIGTMDQREKTAYILEQMRLVLLRNDYIRLPIISKKLNPKILAGEATLRDLKLRYYEYLILHYMHEEEWIETSHCYRNILETPDLTQPQSIEALVGAVMFLLLAPLSEAQLGMVSQLLTKYKRLFDEIPMVRDFAKMFLGNALIRSVDASVAQLPHLFGDSKLHADRGIAPGKDRLVLLEKRIVQFNLVKVLSQFYSRMRLQRLAGILNLSVERAETEITELVTNKALRVKIDRPAGIVSFHPRVSPQAKLDEWAGNINKAMDLVESTSNLIQKEIQLHSAKQRLKT